MTATRILDILPWMVPMLPFFGFVVLALFGDRINKDGEQRGAMLTACAVAVLSFACSIGTAVAWYHFNDAEMGAPVVSGVRSTEVEVTKAPPSEGRARFMRYSPSLFRETDSPFMLEVGHVLQVPYALLIDPLTIVMILVVTGIGSLIHIYSLGYMSHDPERVRYFSYLNLFTFFMLVLVMAQNLPLMFVGWEGVGLSSYLLIGFWFKKKSASDAGKKAFVVNRIGDAGLILGMAVMYHSFGTFDLDAVADNAAARLPLEALGQFGPVTLACLLLFIGACGKSAQIPLHIWLPDAMEGPTPVSALIHAATMVTAGVYMVARLGPFYALSETALLVIAVVGTTTALMAATIALVQTDIKKVLAYSTVSQLGYMFLACGVGAFGVAIFHLFTHAFFKALLFLGSGSVIHALSGEQDLRKMGGLRKKIPWTFGTFTVGTLAIAGIPPLAGFFSKDAILAAAYEHHKIGLFAVGMLTALLTAFYMSRMFFLTFFGEYRGEAASHGDHHGDAHGHGGIHESPPSMLVPLVLLAIGSAVVGFVHIPDLIGYPHGDHPGWLPVVATLTAVLGIAGAWLLYLRAPHIPQQIGASLAAVRRVLEAKWGFDTAGEWLAYRAIVDVSREVLWRRVDSFAIDGVVNGTATVTAKVAEASRSVQSGLTRVYVLLILGGAVALLGYLLWLPR